ncbi:low-affinity inorganic phosphate transporter 2 [Escherichia coli]|nr:low-affinity inorganic phosphate transporter 2 [Escherichia coli]
MEPPLPAASTDGTQVTEFHCHPANTFDAIARVKTMLPGNMESYEPLSVSQRSQLRRIMLCISDTSAKLAKLPGVSKEDQNLLKKLRSDM